MAEFLTPREGGCEYEPPESLWKMITSYVAESEWQEVKKKLGGDLVEQSMELHEEVGEIGCHIECARLVLQFSSVGYSPSGVK